MDEHPEAIPEGSAVDTGGELPARVIRSITVIVPMRDEAAHVEHLIEDLAAQSWDGDLEVLVADGASTDGSAELALAAADRHGLRLRVLDNHQGFVSRGLNRCIREASGDLLVRMDCHSRYPPDYLSRCAAVSEETGAENVGGIFVPRGSTPTERAVACAMNSPFGGIHWTRHGEVGRVDVDTVPYGAFRPEAFERAGPFDESLVRDQDDEFNLRLRLAGGRVVQDPSIRVEYTPRGSIRAVAKQYFEYGRWKPAVMRKHRRATSARSLVPASFVGSLLVLFAFAPWSAAARSLLAALVVVYTASAVAFGAAAVRRCGESWRLLPRVVAAFPAFHLAHGLGMLVGALRLAVGRR